MDAKRFRRYLNRDSGCIHCGETEAVAPHHRRNRGMGGSKVRDVPSNIVVLCSVLNGLLESDPFWARKARDWGWKLGPGDDPREVPVWVDVEGVWVWLDDKYGRELVPRGSVSGKPYN